MANPTCSTCNLPLEPADDAPRTFVEDLGPNWQIAGYTNAAGCEHYREERAYDGSGDNSEWWADLGDLREAIADAVVAAGERGELSQHLCEPASTPASPQPGYCARCGHQWPTPPAQGEAPDFTDAASREAWLINWEAELEHGR